MPTVDIVVATVGRTHELVRLVDSVGAQTLEGVRLIAVDQNDDDRVAPILARLPHRVPALHLRSEPGLSRARNAALPRVTADLVTFADDDCWYAPDLLERVVTHLDAEPTRDGLSGISIDEATAPSNARWDVVAGPIDRRNVWRRAVSYTIFLRRSVIEAVGPFDEELGVGSGTDFGSGEETDYLLRALASGFTVWYEPSLAVFHPQARRTFDAAAVAAGRPYGMGMGRVLRKHGYPARVAAYHAARAAGGSLLSLLRRDLGAARFHRAVAEGRLRGWLAPAARPRPPVVP